MYNVVYYRLRKAGMNLEVILHDADSLTVLHPTDPYACMVEYTDLNIVDKPSGISWWGYLASLPNSSVYYRKRVVSAPTKRPVNKPLMLASLFIGVLLTLLLASCEPPPSAPGFTPEPTNPPRGNPEGTGTR